MLIGQIVVVFAECCAVGWHMSVQTGGAYATIKALGETVLS